jgi:hypothetical protein
MQTRSCARYPSDVKTPCINRLPRVVPIANMYATFAIHRTSKSTAGVQDGHPIRYVSMASSAVTTAVEVFVVRTAMQGDAGTSFAAKILNKEGFESLLKLNGDRSGT